MIGDLNEAVAQVWAAIRETLDEMGTESLAAGPYGLRLYPTYVKECLPGLCGKNAGEVAITHALAKKLNGKRVGGHMIAACPEKPYPCGGRCDIVVCVNRLRLWIECKSLWKHLIKPDVDACDPKRWREDKWRAGVNDIIQKDVVMLGKLGPAEATHAAVFLFGFDHVDYAVNERELYEDLRLGELGKPPWVAAHGRLEGIVRPDMYSVRARNGCRERFWFWCRPVEN